MEFSEKHERAIFRRRRLLEVRLELKGEEDEKDDDAVHEKEALDHLLKFYKEVEK